MSETTFYARLVRIDKGRYEVRGEGDLGRGIAIERDHGSGTWRIQRETWVTMTDGLRGYRRTILGYEDTLWQVRARLARYFDYCEEVASWA
mgnify:CR=1 FL=1